VPQSKKTQDAEAHNDVIAETMKISFKFFLADFGLPAGETYVEFLNHSGKETTIKFSPSVITMLKEAFEELHCCQAGCKLNVKFSKNTVTVIAENFAQASAEVQYLVGSIAMKIKTAKKKK
jgi:hypothetical protein